MLGANGHTTRIRGIAVSVAEREKENPGRRTSAALTFSKAELTGRDHEDDNDRQHHRLDHTIVRVYDGWS